MVRQVVIFEVFLASPSDMSPERQIVADIIEEQNQIWEPDRGVRLRLLTWDKDVTPGVGIDPQAVINEQIGDDYDLLIGVLGTRFGSPTTRAGSGTEEEFLRAHERFRETGSPKIMLYFSEKPLPPDDIDLEQLGKVRDFREDVSEEGVLYGSFRSGDEFEKLLRLHLNRVLKDLMVPSAVPARSEAPPEEEMEESEPVEAGLIDSLEEVFERGAEFREVMSRMTEATTDLGERLEQRRAQMQKLGQVQNGQGLKRAKAAILGAAADVSRFVRGIKVEIPAYSESFGGLANASTELVGLLRHFETDESKEDVEEAEEQSEALLESIRTSRASVAEFRQTIAKWPPVSKSLNKARRDAVNVLEELDQEMEISENLQEEVVIALRDYLSDSGM